MKNRRKHKSLWPRVCGVTLALSCLVGMAGCGEEDEEKASIEGTYVRIWDTLYDWYDTGDTLYEDCEDGVKAYLSYCNLDHQNLTPEDYTDVVIGDKRTGYGSVLYLERDRIQSYSGYSEYGEIYRYTGTYRLEGERLVANYEMARSNFNYENGTYAESVITEDTVGHGRMVKALMDTIREANETKTILSYVPSHCYQDRTPYIFNGYFAYGDDWVRGGYVSGGYCVELLWKGDYLVAEEQGYTLEVEEPGETFTLICDENEFFTCEFYNNHWKNGYNQTGETILIDDHVLMMLPPDHVNYADYTLEDISLFYLDFQNEKVYFPMYVKSDSMDRLVKEMNQDPIFQ